MQYVSPQGAIVAADVGHGLPVELPVDARTRALAASGSGSFFSDAHVQRRAPARCSPSAWAGRGAAQIARPLTEVDRALRSCCSSCSPSAGVGILLAAALGWVVARAALAPVARFTRRPRR